MSAPNKVQLAFDYRELDPEDRVFVKEREVLIRETAKRTAEAIMRIGQWLSEVHNRLARRGRYSGGKWAEWLDRCFDWKDSTARRLMRVYECFNSANLEELESIDVSALYLMAEPSTPEVVRQEVIKLARNGEPMSRAKAIEVLDEYRKQSLLPTPAVAREIAIATGKHIASNNGFYMPPVTEAAQKAAAAAIYASTQIRSAIQNLAEAKMSAADFMKSAKRWDVQTITEEAPAALRWLSSLVEELKDV